MSAEHQKQRVIEVLCELNYDFDHFVLGDFLAHIEKQRKKPIRIQDFSLVDVDLFSAWIPTPEMDYILVSDDTHPVHRAHNILHEVGHMILGHRRMPFKGVLKPELLRLLGIEEAQGRTRSVYDLRNTPEEREAEEFVFQIRDRVSRANRLHELIDIGTSIEALRPIINSTAS